MSETAKIRRYISQYLKDKDVVLDIGCGDDKVIDKAIGIDINKNLNNVDLLLNAEKLNYEDRTVDVVYSSHCLEHINQDYVIVLKEWLRVLKIGGLLILYLPDIRKYTEHNPEHFHNFIPEHFMRRIADAGILEFTKLIELRENFDYSFLVILEKVR